MPFSVHHRIRLLKREKAIYEKRIAEDSILLEKLQYDEYLEQYAREHYHMQRHNEDVYIIELLPRWEGKDYRLLAIILIVL